MFIPRGGVAGDLRVAVNNPNRRAVGDHHERTTRSLVGYGVVVEVERA
jgi:hypothetical protein